MKLQMPRERPAEIFSWLIWRGSPFLCDDKATSEVHRMVLPKSLLAKDSNFWQWG